MKLKIADRLSFPADVVTQTIGILAKRRAGKSYTARRLVEQLHHAGLQVVIIDPKGDWWGIRASADGRGAGLPITILGGERGDVPLEKSGGELVAKLVVEERVSALLDLSLFRKGEVAVFMTGFLEALYRIKARDIYRTPVMLVIDEADAIAPQKPQRGEERMLGAAEDIVRRGGQRGIGCTLITQRSAVLNKNVLTQVQILIALRTIAPQDLKAMDAWIDVHGTEEERRTLMESLPALPVGDAWIWSPGWPTASGIFERVHVLPIETFDSGETPKPGQKRAEPKTLADVDLEALRRQMADVVKRAEESDPKALRARVAVLERELAATKRAGSAAPAPPADHLLATARAKGAQDATEHVMRDAKRQISSVVASAEAGRGRAARAIDQALEQLKRAADALREPIDVPEIVVGNVSADKISDIRHRTSQVPVGTSDRTISPKRGIRAENQPPADGSLTGPEQRILDAIAWLEALGLDGPFERAPVAFLARYTVGSGGFNNPLGRLRSAGLVEYPREGTIAITDAGRAVARAPEGALTVDELHARVRERVDTPMWRCLEPLLAAYPEPMEREALAAAANYELGSGGFNNPLGRLRSLGLIDYPSPGRVVALPVLFLEAT